jgi:hypothetical protein
MISVKSISRAKSIHTSGKNCQSHEMSSQFSRDGGINPAIKAMLMVMRGPESMGGRAKFWWSTRRAVRPGQGHTVGVVTWVRLRLASSGELYSTPPRPLASTGSNTPSMHLFMWRDMKMRIQRPLLQRLRCVGRLPIGTTRMTITFRLDYSPLPLRLRKVKAHF